MMRKVEIDHQQGEEYPFVAIDRATGHVLFRHDNLEELERVCRKVGWDVARVFTPSGAGDPQFALGHTRI
jgi:hypothetical protein